MLNSLINVSEHTLPKDNFFLCNFGHTYTSPSISTETLSNIQEQMYLLKFLLFLEYKFIKYAFVSVKTLEYRFFLAISISLFNKFFNDLS